MASSASAASLAEAAAQAALAEAALAEAALAKAALAEAVLARERARMTAEDSEALIAQRFFCRSLQLPLPDPSFERFYSWRSAFERCQNNWLAALDAMLAARTANRAGDARGVREALEQELGSDPEDDDQDLGSNPEDDDAYQDLHSALQPANAALVTQPAMFTGTAHRLG